MAKKSYRIKAYVWDKRNREYVPETIEIIKDYGDALIAFQNLEISKDMVQIELIEQSLNKHGFVIQQQSIKMKDHTGEYDGEFV